MNYIIYSPLEQFEFITIGIFPSIKINVFIWLNLFDHSNFLQTLYSTKYQSNILNTHSVIIEGFVNLSFLELLEFIKNSFENIEAEKLPVKPDILDLLYYEDNNVVIDKDLVFKLKLLFNDSEYSNYTLFWLNIYNSVIIVLVLYVIFFIYFNMIDKNIKFFNVWTYLTDLFFSFLLQTFLSLADRRLLNYFPVFCTFFIVIFLSNLTALVPLSFCLTSNLWLTLTLSFSVWVSVTVLAIIVRGFGFFSGFVPSNVPAALKGFITVIEVISYLARAISLGVRIFANMLAGHSLVHILSDLVETCIISFNHVSLKIFGIFPAIILTFILFIEFGICFLQALVFVILTAIYLKEAFGFAAH